MTERRMAKLGVTVKTMKMPKTLEDLRELKPFEFQNFVIQRVHGTHSARKVGDMGIDGYSFFEGLPIQVKQSDKIGRNVVDNFETAIRRDGKHKGYIIAFSFGTGAYEEAARAKSEGLEVALIGVDSLLDEPDTHLQPGVSEMVADLFRAVEIATEQQTSSRARRTIAELVASEQRA